MRGRSSREVGPKGVIPARRVREGVQILLCALGLVAGCGGAAPDWGDDDFIAVYAAALEAVNDAAGVADTLFVDPRPRFLEQEGSGAVRMGDFNRFGDPALSRAIARSPFVATCVAEASGGCSWIEHDGFAVLSEVVPLGHREAVLLTSHVDFRDGGASFQNLFVQLRFWDHEWRVSQVGEAERIEVPGGPWSQAR